MSHRVISYQLSIQSRSLKAFDWLKMCVKRNSIKVFFETVYGKYFNMDNVYTAVRPFALFAKFIGLFPKSVEGLVIKENFKTKFSDMLLSSFLLSIIIAMMFLKMMFGIAISSAGFTALAWDISIYMLLSMLLIQFVMQIFKSGDIINFLDLLNNFDRNAVQLDLVTDHTRHKQLTLIAAIIILTLNLFSSLVPAVLFWLKLTETNSMFVSISFFYTGTSELFYTYQFCLASLSLRERFKLLNTCLRNFWIKQKIKKFSESEPVKTIKHVSKLYLDLCDLIEVVNSTFTYHLVFVFISVLVWCRFQVLKVEFNLFCELYSVSQFFLAMWL